MSSTLLINLKGPLQAWGVDSVFPVRRTGRVPSKSGVLGMVACALGRRRGESLEDLASLEFAVRIERQGVLMEDNHNATRAGSVTPMLSRRQYLCDAHFTAGLGGDREELEVIRRALLHPRWPLYLGRRSCPPMGPVVHSLVEGRPVEILKDLPAQESEVFARHRSDEDRVVLDIYTDARPESTRYEVARDIPVDFSLERRIHHERRFEENRSQKVAFAHARQRSEPTMPTPPDLGLHDPMSISSSFGECGSCYQGGPAGKSVGTEET
ncbi:type I-E CRISPR-associated protein Cas5/CasD [Rothia koreensis]|uniref:type I-E CRISPR-associated protein Cas5/CasD n=1 Tax=Rothia koreensis TaxID=592378 RepID=UPI003FCD6B1F